MPEYRSLEVPDNPRLAQNIVHFARALRRAGLPVGPGRVIDAIRAVEAAGFTDRIDFFEMITCFAFRLQPKASLSAAGTVTRDRRKGQFIGQFACTDSVFQGLESQGVARAQGQAQHV